MRVASDGFGAAHQEKKGGKGCKASDHGGYKRSCRLWKQGNMAGVKPVHIPAGFPGKQSDAVAGTITFASAHNRACAGAPLRDR